MALTYDYSSMSLGAIFCYIPLVVIVITLDLWPAWSQVLGYLSSDGDGFHLMDWALNPIS